MAFDGATKTTTNEHKGSEDKNPPDWKRLNPSQINTKTALAGVAACTDGKVVNGDLREFIQKDRQTTIMENDSLHIQGTQTEDVEQTATITIKNGRDMMIGVFDKVQVSGDRQIWVNGADSEYYLTHREIHEPAEKFEYKRLSWEYGLFGVETMASGFETKALSLAVENVKVEAKMFEETNQLIAGKVDAITARAEGMDVNLGLLLLRIANADSPCG